MGRGAARGQRARLPADDDPAAVVHGAGADVPRVQVPGHQHNLHNAHNTHNAAVNALSEAPERSKKELVNPAVAHLLWIR